MGLSDTFQDNGGNTVTVGEIVGYDEMFDDGTGRLYVVVNILNYGDMVGMTEITDHSYDVEKKTDTYNFVDKDAVIHVEPWKIAAI